MHRLARLALVLFLVVTGLMTAAGAAQAGEKRYWDNEDVAPYDKGYARGGLKVEFLSKRAVDIEGFIEDMCAKDGYSAEIHFSVNYNGARHSDAFPRYLDTNGCGNGRRYFDPAPFKTLYAGTLVSGIEAYICQTNLDAQNPFVGRCAKQYFDNWRVG